MLSPQAEKWGDASPRPPPIDARAYCARHLLVQAQCPATSQAESTADGSDERLLGEVLASRLPYSDTRYSYGVAFLRCNTVLWCVYYVAYIRTIFMCALHYTFALRCPRGLSLCRGTWHISGLSSIFIIILCYAIHPLRSRKNLFLPS